MHFGLSNASFANLFSPSEKRKGPFLPFFYPFLYSPPSLSIPPTPPSLLPSLPPSLSRFLPPTLPPSYPPSLPLSIPPSHPSLVATTTLPTSDV